MKVYNRQFVARTATTDRVMRTTDREYVHTTVSLNKKHNERDDEMVQLKKIILQQTARHSQEYNSDKLLGHKGLYFTDLSLVTIYSLWYKKRYKSQLSTIPVQRCGCCCCCTGTENRIFDRKICIQIFRKETQPNSSLKPLRWMTNAFVLPFEAGISRKWYVQWKMKTPQRDASIFLC